MALLVLFLVLVVSSSGVVEVVCANKQGSCEWQSGAKSSRASPKRWQKEGNFYRFSYETTGFKLVGFKGMLGQFS